MRHQFRMRAEVNSKLGKAHGSIQTIPPPPLKQGVLVSLIQIYKNKHISHFQSLSLCTIFFISISNTKLQVV